jgi:O-antigen/teichoic acid export membrane protein
MGTGAFSIAALGLLTRVLSPEDFGLYALVTASAAGLSGIVFQWLGMTTARFAVVDSMQGNMVVSLIAKGFWVVSTLLALGFAIGVFLLPQMQANLATMVLTLAATISIGAYTLALQQANATMAPIRYGLIAWSRAVATLLGSLLLVSWGMGASGAILGMVLGTLAVVSYFSWALFRLTMSVSVDPQVMRRMLHYGFPLVLGFLAIAIVDLADRFMIHAILGAGALAPYAAAYDVVQLAIGPLLNVFFLARFPAVLCSFERQNTRRLQLHLYRLGEKLLALGLPALMGLVVIANDLAGLLFGNGLHKQASLVLPFLAIAILIGCLKTYFLDIGYHLQRQTRVLAGIAFAMAALNLVLNAVFIQWHGIFGAAVATAFSFLFGATLSALGMRKFFRLRILAKVALLSTVASGVMAMVLSALPDASSVGSLVLKIAVGLLTYTLLALSLNIAACRKVTKNLWRNKTFRLKRRLF